MEILRFFVDSLLFKFLNLAGFVPLWPDLDVSFGLWEREVDVAPIDLVLF